MGNTDYFILYANCIPVKGFSRSLICDLHREEYSIIPNSLCEIITIHAAKSVSEIKAVFDNKYDETIDEYFDFLIEKEYIYLCEKEFLQFFPPLSTAWEYPAIISNAIFDFNTIPDYFNADFANNLDLLGCKHIQFRCYNNPDIFDFLYSVISLFDTSGISTISIYWKYDLYNIEELKEAVSKFPRIEGLYLLEAPKNHVEFCNYEINSQIVFSKSSFSASKVCGVVRENYFAPNIPHYTESLHHNTCLNRKIAIDVDGNIKNCPSMKESFGNIKDTTLEEAINKPGFKKYWNITKDKITKCKDCEFRHICTDCRAYLENPDDIYSAPLKCGYDPYTCKWEEWSTNPLKQKTIDYYGMRDLVNNE